MSRHGAGSAGGECPGIRGGIRPLVDEREIGGTHWSSVPEVSELIQTQQITDGVSLTALLLTFHLGHLGGNVE